VAGFAAAKHPGPCAAKVDFCDVQKSRHRCPPPQGGSRTVAPGSAACTTLRSSRQLSVGHATPSAVTLHASWTTIRVACRMPPGTRTHSHCHTARRALCCKIIICGATITVRQKRMPCGPMRADPLARIWDARADPYRRAGTRIVGVMGVMRRTGPEAERPADAGAGRYDVASRA
jgi:hypothetical protein